jgi:hypothetical protein
MPNFIKNIKVYEEDGDPVDWSGLAGGSTANTAIGATTDAAVVTDTTGTLSGKLRGLVKWAFERMPASLGQKAASASLAVVLASDQYTGSLTARGGTITTGGTAQQLAASNSSRKYLIVQNQSSGDLYIRFTGTAVADTTSLKLVPGAVYESGAGFVSTQALSIIGATTGQAFYAAEG